MSAASRAHARCPAPCLASRSQVAHKRPRPLVTAHADSPLYRRQDGPELEQYIEHHHSQSPIGEAAKGPLSVYLVGTGPGDPGLMTLQAVHLLQTADVILYDRLVSEDILRMAHPRATLVYVGKQQGYHSRTQEEIHELLLRFARTGARTVRLKGGDPFVFGRGAEESQYLEARGVFVHIVAGITAAAGISALLGIPLTHRGVATSVRFLTGHAREGDAEALDQTVCAAADRDTTLVVYMGLATLPALAAQLQNCGMPADKPAVAVERGTLPDSRLCHGTLAELPQRTVAAGLRSPTLIVIGDVVALSPGWKLWHASGKPAAQPAPLPLHVDLGMYQQRGGGGAVAGLSGQQQVREQQQHAVTGQAHDRQQS